MKDDFIYFDYNATTPIDPRVARAMRPFLTGFFGNPSSVHLAGRQAREAVENARRQVAEGIGCRSEGIIFTSGGTESNNMAIHGLLPRGGGGHVVTSAVEHPAIMEVVRSLQERGLISLTIVGVDEWGRVDPVDVEGALRPETFLVSVMLANNEVGTLQPLAEISEICKKQGILLHTDAAQAVGKVPVNVEELGVDLLSVAGHKLYAPKGVGALFVRSGVSLDPLIRGAGHERGLRPGTENVLGLVGLGAAFSLIEGELGPEMSRLERLRNRLRRLLAGGFPGLLVHGHRERRLPNTLSVAFPGIESSLLLDRLRDEVAASAGAACHGDDVVLSPVLTAMGLRTEICRATIRLSLGRFTTDSEVEEGAERILGVIREVGPGKRFCRSEEPTDSDVKV
ncbi:MAG: cysteine desulfurase [Thermoanaerobaculales bacterium]|nr:cysteine desulfurase [Thermoanaerobaculales bacterium]